MPQSWPTALAVTRRWLSALPGLPLNRFGNWRAKLKHEEPASADKRRIVDEACRPGALVSGVARQYGITARRLFPRKQELAPAAKTETTFLPVTITDAPEQSAEASQPPPGLTPVIVERSAPGIEVEVIGGRRVRF